MTKNKKTELLAKLSILTATIIWGSSFVVMKNTVATVPTYLLLAVRFTLASFFLFVLYRKNFKKFNLDYIKKGSLLGIFQFAGFALQTVGVKYTTPGKNAFLTAVYCVVVPFMCWATDKKKPDIYNFIAGIVCLVGIGCVSLTDKFTMQIGDLLSLLCGVAFAVPIIQIVRFGKGRDIALLTFVEYAVGTLLAWSFSFILKENISSVSWNFDVIAALMYLAIFSTCIGSMLQNTGQQHTTPSVASLLLSLEAVFGVIFSVIFYGEKLTGKIGIGFFLIFIAVVVSETKLKFLNKKNQSNLSDEKKDLYIS